MSWNENRLTSMLGIQYPILQAPMAGGITSPELVSAVSEYGGLGNIGAGYMQPEEMKDAIIKIRTQTSKPFGVNLFIMLENVKASQEEEKTAANVIGRLQHELQLETIPKLPEKDYRKLYTAQAEVLLREKVPVVSFTFGIPEKELVKELKQTGAILIGTATNLEEAIQLEESGMDAIVAQGVEAGGHRGTFLEEESGLVGLFALIPMLTSQLRVPIIAAGGIMDGQAISASLMLGAQGAQLGTAFLTCKESSAHSVYKQAILDRKEDTILTKAFSGKLARGIKNKFMDEMQGNYILPFPLQNDLTGAMRKQAGTLGKPEFMSLWAGQGYRLAKELTVEELMEELIAEADKAFQSAAF